MREKFITVERAATAEYEEKKSRFIAEACPAKDESEALAFLDSVKTRRRDASHNVFAYVVPVGGGLPDGVTAKRQSDDGEPSGTAGAPTLEAIEKRGLSDVIVVVTRYFGGTLLGAAGLVRAYGKAAVASLNAAGTVIMAAGDEVKILAPYSCYGAIKREIARVGLCEKSVSFGTDTEITLTMRKQTTQDFITRINDICRGDAVCLVTGDVYVAASQTADVV